MAKHTQFIFLKKEDEDHFLLIKQKEYIIRFPEKWINIPIINRCFEQQINWLVIARVSVLFDETKKERAREMLKRMKKSCCFFKLLEQNLKLYTKEIELKSQKSWNGSKVTFHFQHSFAKRMRSLKTPVSPTKEVRLKDMFIY